MKLDRLEVHDRYSELSKYGNNISECCQDMIKKRPFGDIPFYIFAHMRTAENGVDKILIWQPRLTKPKAQTNSMLFKAFPLEDIVEVIWMIPPREMWDEFSEGKMMHNKTVAESVYKFVHDRGSLEAKDEGDLSDEKIEEIYANISRDARRRKNELSNHTNIF